MATLLERGEIAVTSIENSAQIQSDIVSLDQNTVVPTPAGDIRTVANAINIMSQTNPTGAWITATAYLLKDLAVEAGVIYICTLANTSGVFATDLAAGKWAVHQSGISSYFIDSGVADAYILTTTGVSVPVYSAGLEITFIPLATCTGASTVNVDGLGLENIKTVYGTDPSGGNIIAGDLITAIYDGTDFVITNGMTKVFEEKSLASSATAVAILTDLTFPTTIGKSYRITGQFRVALGDFVTTEQSLGIIVKDNPIQIGYTNFHTDECVVSSISPTKIFSLVYKAVGTSLTFQISSNPGLDVTLVSASFRQGTYMILEEIDPIVIGTIA